jgi:cytochrome o ubiquinol oxidase subunit I
MEPFGRLTLDAFMHDGITGLLLIGTVVMGLLGSLLTAVALTYFKRWRWSFRTSIWLAKYLWTNWLTSLDPKKIGVMYIVVATVMLLRGISDALMMRAQQALAPAADVLSTETFQQVFSAHGTIMIFFVAMGFMFGLLNLVVPLQIGARDVAARSFCLSYPHRNTWHAFARSSHGHAFLHLRFWRQPHDVHQSNLGLGSS